MDVKSVAGDILRVKNGTYSEILPIKVRSGISVMGETLRNTRVTPASGNGTQIKTMKVINNPSSGKTNGEYKYLHPSKTEKQFAVLSTPDSTNFTCNIGTSSLVHTYVRGGTVTNAAFGSYTISNVSYDNTTGVATITTSSSHGLSVSDNVKLTGMDFSTLEGTLTLPKVGSGAVFSIIVQGNTAVEFNTYHGGAGYSVGDIITLASGDTGGAGDITLQVGSTELNAASNMWLCNDSNNIRNFTFTGLTSKKRAGGLYQVTVTSANSFTVPTATSDLTHNYVSGGNVIIEGAESTDVAIQNYAYAHAAGQITVNTDSNHGLTTGDYVTLAKAKFNITDVGERVIP